MAGIAKELVREEGFFPGTVMWQQTGFSLSFYYYIKPSQCFTKIKLRFVAHLFNR